MVGILFVCVLIDVAGLVFAVVSGWRWVVGGTVCGGPIVAKVGSLVLEDVGCGRLDLMV